MSENIRPNRRYLMAVAVMTAAGMTVFMSGASAQVVGVRQARPMPIAEQPPVVSRPDVDNTGKPEDPAGPPSRDPGDLMSSGTLVYVDDSFASVDKLRAAIRQANQGQSQLAINSFQTIVNDYGQKLVLLNDNSYVSITDYVREKLLAMPAVKNGMYDQLFGLEAKREVDAAVDEQDVSKLIRVSDKYFPSTAALKGMAQAAEWYFERGEFAAAGQTWRKLLIHPLAGERKADFLFRAALAEHLGEDATNAKLLRERLASEYPGATGMLSGKQVKLVAKLDELMGMAPWEKMVLGENEWPAFGGDPSHAQLMKSNASIGAKLWSVKTKEAAAPQSGVTISTVDGVQLQQRLLISSSMVIVDSNPNAITSYPVLSNGTLYVHLGGRIVAISANAGTQMWAYPREAGPQGTGGTVAHNFVSVFGEYVYAAMPAASYTTSSGGRSSTTSRVACLKKEDGGEVWSRSAGEIPLDKPGTLTFIGSPLVTRQGVFVMARKSADANFTPLYLVRLERETGKPTWSCYLCSTSNTTSMYDSSTGMTGQMTIPVPTLVDDVLYINTGQGADCAVDANVGRILWLRPTVTKPTMVGGGIGGRVVTSDMVLMNQNSVSWKYNPPLILGEKMITTDAQVLRIYDRWNGKLLKAIKATDLIDPTRVSGTPTLDVLAGAVGTKIVLSLKNASVCYELDALLAYKPTSNVPPEPVWIASIAGNPAGQPQGRPFLTTTGYYVPFASKLVRINLQTGKAEQWDWPKNEMNEPGKPGNLLVTSEQVVVVNDLEVAGYSKWETALDNRMAKIQAAPKDPGPHLELAEISFRTEHFELAQEHMKQAVDLANAGNAPAGRSVADMLGTLYRTNLVFAELLLEKNEPGMRDRSRFYYEQCKAAARTPEQGAQWRIGLSVLALKQTKPDEAAGLYSEILADPTLRQASFREEDGMQRASAAAERRLKNLIGKNGAGVYARFEAQAAAQTQRATAAKDTAGLQQVVDVYPNSAASLTAATNLAGLHLDKQDWESARSILGWLVPRLDKEPQAQAMANLATACVGIKKYTTALNWAERGARMYPDFAWTGAGKKISFADFKAQIAKAGGTDIVGRLPVVPKKGADEGIKMSGAALSNENLLEGVQLLAPVETTSALRSPYLLFIRSGNQVRIRDTVKNEEAGVITLPANADAVLLGVTKDTAVLLQAGSVVGYNLKTQNAWNATLAATPRSGITGPSVGRGGLSSSSGGTRRVSVGTRVEVIGNMIYVSGSPYTTTDTNITIMDTNGVVLYPDAGGNGTDPESARRAALSVLGSTARFSTARILNGKLYILAYDTTNSARIQTYDIATGKLAWSNTGDIGRLPDGTAESLVGNEDMLVVQVDITGNKASVFCAFDADTGKPGKQIKMEDERGLWRTLGDDGMLYVVTDKSVAGFDMLSDRNWRRKELNSRYAGATILTLDGLVVVTENSDVRCLAPESGETRWKTPLPSDLVGVNTANTSSMRSTVSGDLVIMQSSTAIAAFYSQIKPPDAERPERPPQVAWINSTQQSKDLPPRLSMQPFEGYTAELLMGPIGTPPSTSSTRTVKFQVRRTPGGKMDINQFVPMTANNEKEGPFIRSWQVVDGGIAYETLPSNQPSAANQSAKVYFWRIK